MTMGGIALCSGKATEQAQAQPKYAHFTPGRHPALWLYIAEQHECIQALIIREAELNSGKVMGRRLTPALFIEVGAAERISAPSGIISGNPPSVDNEPPDGALRGCAVGQTAALAASDGRDGLTLWRTDGSNSALCRCCKAAQISSVIHADPLLAEVCSQSATVCCFWQMMVHTAQNGGPATARTAVRCF